MFEEQNRKKNARSSNYTCEKPKQEVQKNPRKRTKKRKEKGKHNGKSPHAHAHLTPSLSELKLDRAL
jgi:hypothetical protein